MVECCIHGEMQNFSDRSRITVIAEYSQYIHLPKISPEPELVGVTKFYFREVNKVDITYIWTAILLPETNITSIAILARQTSKRPTFRKFVNPIENSTLTWSCALNKLLLLLSQRERISQKRT